MKLLFVGDVMLGRLVNEALKYRPPEYPWGNTLPVFKQADFRICNLECAMSDRGAPWSLTPKVFHFRTDAKNVKALEAAGISAVSLANNHILDFELEGLVDTLKILTEAKIGFSGAGMNMNDVSQASMSTVAGEEIAFIAFTDNEPDWEATESQPGVFFVPIDITDHRARYLFDKVREAKSQNRLVIVSAHWGGNWGYRPPAEARLFAYELVIAGADVVYGHSAHVFRGIEIFEQKIILYSTGDFIDDYAVDEVERNDESFIFLVETNGSVISKLFLHPTVIREFSSHLAGPGLAENIAEKMQILCGEMGTNAAWNSKEGYLEINIA